jgi:hypothetical protein
VVAPQRAMTLERVTLKEYLVANVNASRPRRETLHTVLVSVRSYMTLPELIYYMNPVSPASNPSRSRVRVMTDPVDEML